MSERPDNEIIFYESGFWVVFRRKLFGPFDYQWSGDLYGIEFTYQGRKFGEVCSEEEIFADLKPFRLPMTVCRVAAVTLGDMAVGIRNGRDSAVRIEDLTDLLKHFGLQRFAIRRQ